MFIEALAVELSLEISGTTTTVPGAHVRHLELDLHAYGFTAALAFWSPSLYLSQDALFSSFKGLDAITVELSIIGQYNVENPTSSAAPDPIKVAGLVTRKWVSESSYGQVSGSDSYHRLYHIEFADIARVLWTQHFPSVLITDSTIQDLIDAQKPTGLTLSYDWSVLTIQYAMLFLGLDSDHSEASFYDFLLWLVRTQNGVFTYDGSANSYKLASSKAALSSPATPDELEVEELRVNIPETIRHNVAVLNAVAEQSANQSVEQDQAITGVRRDMLMRTPVPADVDTRVSLESKLLVARDPTVDLVFKSYPTVAVTPGSGLSFTTADWSLHTTWLTGDYRAYRLTLRADAIDQLGQTDLQRAHTPYQVTMSAELEPSGETYVVLPEFRRPRWPVMVEGKVLSESGEDTDKTYQVTEDSDTSLYTYDVTIPLWGKTVSALLDPIGMPGHFYFPAFKDQRVLVALSFQSASITRFLDFGARTRLTMDSQGNHILFGQNETSETSMRYAYEDDKSLFEVKRVMDKDNVTLQMKDGLLYLEVREDES